MNILKFPAYMYQCLILILFSFNSSLVSYLLHCTRLCPIVILILSPPPLFLLLFYLGYVM